MKKRNRSLHNCCLQILRAYDMPRDSYRSTEITIDDVVKELREEITYGNDPDKKAMLIKYPLHDIAAELIAIGDACPTPKKDKYHLIWDTDHCTDGFDCGNNKNALRFIMEDFLINLKWQFGEDPNHRSVDDWNYMIYNNFCRCYRNADLVPDVDLDRIWCRYLTQAECKNIGWVTTDEMDDETYQSFAEVYGWPKR